MAFIAGLILLDAPASALNNAGAERGAKTDNTIAVKKIDRQTPYVSAQSFRYWLRSVAAQEPGWISAAVWREKKVAYADADPVKNWDDDLFGYMRAPSKRVDAARPENASPLDAGREITRVSPLRVSTFVSVAPATIINDFGTMSRQDGDPVPHEHQFYRAQLQGLISLDLTSSGTFYDMERTGFKNMDDHRREAARSAGCMESKVRGQRAWRLPLLRRQERVAALLHALSNISGGAKQALHYTDLTPAVIFLAVVRNGNNPFYRTFIAGRESDRHQAVFHRPAFEQVMDVYADDFLSEIYIGWSRGFLENEFEKMQAAVQNSALRERIRVEHPVRAIQSLVDRVKSSNSNSWFD